MIRLSHTNLEQARIDPGSIAQVGARRFGGPSRVQYVKWAIGRYHDRGLQAGLSYIEEAFERRGFRVEHLARYQGYLVNYAEEFHRRGASVAALSPSIELPASNTVVLTGKLGGIDISPQGYAAWLFAEHIDPSWQDELRMPLIQHCAAEMMGAPASEVQVGVYVLSAGVSVTHVFDDATIRAARRELTRVANRLAP